jgi:tricorn protease
METTQPEYAFWFHDTGWCVENYGVDPTIDVDITPEDYARGHDTQMHKGVDELMKLVVQNEERQKQHSTPPKEPVLAPGVLPLLPGKD